LNFKQRSSTASVLNRINSVDPTTILGSLNANGRVFIVNPSGVLVGPTGKVNVGALFASSLNISDDDFKANRLNFSGGGQGNVVNRGKIIAKESVGLIGSKTVENYGSITSTGGDVVLASADDITLEFADSHLEAKLNKDSLEALVNNGGIIKTEDGDILLTAWGRDSLARSAVNNTGTLEASSLSRDESSDVDRPLYGNVKLIAGKDSLDSDGRWIPGSENRKRGDVFVGGSIFAENGVRISGANITLDGTILSDRAIYVDAWTKASSTDRGWLETQWFQIGYPSLYDLTRGTFKFKDIASEG
jgi:filamentous hemagglutinin family protein